MSGFYPKVTLIMRSHSTSIYQTCPNHSCVPKTFI